MPTTIPVSLADQVDPPVLGFLQESDFIVVAVFSTIGLLVALASLAFSQFDCALIAALAQAS